MLRFLMYITGAWIATVANIDWPSQQAVGTDSAAIAMQQTEMISLLDSLQTRGINTVIFQVRPTADALYYSELEPWSYWLVGPKKGNALSYDPLEFVIDQCHARGMQLHAWVNPYRINIPLLPDSVFFNQSNAFTAHPEWFWKYGQQWYFNPALPETREWLCMVVEDIVCRYDVDAIHMDDYFYPYPIGKKQLPDRKDFDRDPRGFADIADWRRDNVNLAIEALSRTIHETKPQVRFGISPFGIYRSDGRTLSNYNDLYADVLKWVHEGWIDYVVPQLYWEIGNRVAPYDTLVTWWAREIEPYPCQLYIGIAAYKHAQTEIDAQRALNATLPIDGEILYSAKPFINKNIQLTNLNSQHYDY